MIQWLRRTAMVSTTAIIAWLVLWVGIATPLLNLLAPRWLEQQTGQRFEFGLLLLNPFAIALEGEAVAVSDGNGSTRLTLAALTVDIDFWQSINTRTLVVEAIELADFSLTSATPAASAASFAALRIDNLTADMASSRLAIDRVALHEPLVVTDYRDNASSIGTLWQFPGLTATQSASDAPVTPWTWQLGLVELTSGAVRLSSDLLANESMTLEVLDASFQDVSLATDTSTSVAVSARLAEDTTIDLDGSVNLERGVGQLSLTIKALLLEQFAPAIAQHTGTAVSGGSINLSVTTGLNQFLPERILGDVNLSETTISAPDADRPLVEIGHLHLGEVALDAEQQTLALGRVDLSDVQSFLHIFEDGSINLLSLQPLTDEVMEDSEIYAREMAKVEGQPEGQPWQIQIAETTLANSTLDFRDDTLPINFVAHIDNLNGELAGFDTRTDTATTFHATGNINGYSPVVINGEVAHFTTLQDGLLTLSMRGVDLGKLTPYAATYAGYPIERGVMALELDYQLKAGQIRGDNHLRIDQLALGKKQPSDRAVVDLPLQTAVALLSNAAGVIDISLPVAGTANDPTFDIWAAAGTAFTNLLSNVVTAPFRFLASLVGSDDIPQKLLFTPGSGELSTEVKETLANLGEALAARPRVALRLTPHNDDKADTAALQRQQFEQQLLADGITQQDINQRTERWHNSINKLAAAAGLANDLPVVVKSQQLRSSIAVSAIELQQLGNRRAGEVKKYLVDATGLDPQRAAIAAASEDADEIFAGVEMAINIL